MTADSVSLRFEIDSTAYGADDETFLVLLWNLFVAVHSPLSVEMACLWVTPSSWTMRHPKLLSRMYGF